MICMTVVTAIAAAGVIMCGPVFCEKMLHCLLNKNNNGNGGSSSKKK